MISRAFRLPIGKPPFTGARSVALAHFLVKYRPNSLAHYRFAVVISAKNVKLSTARHIIKRSVLDAAREQFSKHIEPGKNYDMLFIIGSQAGKVPKKELPRIMREEVLVLKTKLSK
jgi:ribonuclease P protein component